jgi:NADH-ubiquinone oxidoreductase chain 2
MKLIFKPLFFTSLIAGTIISSSSHSWIGIWLGLEINILSILPIISNNNNKISNQSSIKYFIIQAISSNILIVSISLSIYYSLSYSIMLIINSAILIKIAIAPFHFWFPQIIAGLNWNTAFIIITIQKIAPIIIISFNIQIKFITLIIIVNSLISRISGLYQSILLKIIAFSSINHSRWIIIGIIFNISIFITYFLLYRIITWTLILIFKFINFNRLRQIFYKSIPFYLKSLIFISLLNMIGIPPIIGFIPKWLMITTIIENNMIRILTIIILSSLISIIFYINISLSIFINKSSTKINKNLTHPKYLIITRLIICLLLLATFT